MTTFLVPDNNAFSTLSAGIDDLVTAIPVADVSKFPSVYPYHLSLEEEIVEVAGKSGSNLDPCTRAQEGTAGASHGSGTLLELLITAEAVSEVHDAILALEAAQYTDSDAVAAVPFVIYIPFGAEESWTP